MPSHAGHLPPARTEALLQGRRRLAHAFLTGARLRCEPHAAIIRAGEHPTRTFRLHSGWAMRERLLAGGRRAILSVYLPGDVIGLDGLFAARPTDGVAALTPMICHALPLDDLARAMEQDPALALRIAHLLDRERRRAERQAVSNMRCDAEERLATFLLDLFDRLRGSELVTGLSFRLPLTQQQIGDCLGLTVVHVNRVLRHLREQGVVLAKRNTAVITDLDRLRRLARTADALPAEETAGGAAPGPVLANGTEAVAVA